MTKNKKTRDNFTPSTIRQLRERVSELCSNPECRVLTRGASSNQLETSSIGVAAHITAAASGKGAARYDASLSRDQRSHYDNGIWLCQSCSRLIDVDEDRFSVSLLENWKKQAERISKDNIGKQLLTRAESDRNAFDKVIEHTVGSNSRDLAFGLVDMVEHHDSILKSLDARFDVKTNLIDGSVHSTITALTDDVKITMNMPKDTGLDFGNKLSKLERFGKAFEISADNIRFEGSNLFERIVPNDVKGMKVKIMAPSIKADCELFVVNNEQRRSLQSSKCSIVFGRDLTVVKGLLLNKLIEFEAEVGTHNNESKFIYHFHTKEWLGKDVNKIPFFQKLEKALPILEDNGFFSFEVTNEDYDTIEFGSAKLVPEKSIIERIISIIEYVGMARVVSKKFNLGIKYDYFNATSEEFFQLHELSSLIKSPIEISADEFGCYPRFFLNENEIETIENELSSDKFCYIRINESVKLDSILGEKIPQLVIRQEFNKVKPRIIRSANQNDGSSNYYLELEFDSHGGYRKFIVSEV